MGKSWDIIFNEHFLAPLEIDTNKCYWETGSFYKLYGLGAYRFFFFFEQQLNFNIKLPCFTNFNCPTFTYVFCTPKRCRFLFAPQTAVRELKINTIKTRLLMLQSGLEVAPLLHIGSFPMR
jgi:hypothetical protein